MKHALASEIISPDLAGEDVSSCSYKNVTAKLQAAARPLTIQFSPSGQWAKLWAGLREGFGGAFQQTMDTPGGSQLGSLSLQSYTELFFSVRKALRRAESVHGTVPRTVTLAADQPASELRESDKALARFMAVADGAMALLHGKELPSSMMLGPVGEGALQPWMELLQIMHSEVPLFPQCTHAICLCQAF